MQTSDQIFFACVDKAPNREQRQDWDGWPESAESYARRANDPAVDRAVRFAYLRDERGCLEALACSD